MNTATCHISGLCWVTVMRTLVLTFILTIMYLQYHAPLFTYYKPGWAGVGNWLCQWVYPVLKIPRPLWYFHYCPSNTTSRFTPLDTDFKTLPCLMFEMWMGFTQHSCLKCKQWAVHCLLWVPVHILINNLLFFIYVFEIFNPLLSLFSFPSFCNADYYWPRMTLLLWYEDADVQ